MSRTISELAVGVRNSCSAAAVVGFGLATELTVMSDKLMTGFAFCGFAAIGADMISYFLVDRAED